MRATSPCHKAPARPRPERARTKPSPRGPLGLLETCALIALVATVSGCGGSGGATMTVEEIVFAFDEELDRARVVVSNERMPPAKGPLQTVPKKAGGKRYLGGERPSILAAPPAEMVFESVTVPENARLSFAAGIAGAAHADRPRVRFEVEVDGETVFDRTLAPPDDVDWVPFEATLPARRRVTVVFRTSLVEPGASAEPVQCGFGTPRMTVTRQQPRSTASPDRPNLLYIVVDTLRSDHLGCYGYPRDITPNLDRFAEEGIRYATPVSTAPWTWPATASLLTGLDPYVHGVLNHASCYLPSAATTLAEACQAHRVTTYAVSANPLICRAQNFHQGFEFFDEVFLERADTVNDRFLAWLDEHGEHRFFAYLHYFDPHYPYDPPEDRFLEEVLGGPIPAEQAGDYRDLRKVEGGVKGYLAHRDKRPIITDLYDAEIRFVDEQLGRLRAELERRGLLRDTIVAITSDHGEELFDHGRVGHSVTLYDELIVVPLILWHPARLRPAVIEEQVETVALPAALARLGGLAPPGELEQRTLPLPSSAGRAAPHAHATTERWRDPDEAFYRRQEAIRTGRYKLIVAPDQGLAQLFDLQADPGERTDLAAERPGLLDELCPELRYWAERTEEESLKRGMREQLGDDWRQRLRQLGYLTEGEDEAGKGERESEGKESDPKGVEDPSGPRCPR